VKRVDVFFYGLFMDEARLRARGLAPERVRLARVEGFALRIGQRATLAPEPASAVPGVLMSLAHEELARLYAEPSVAAYRAEPVLAREESGAVVPALCFNLAEPPPAGEADAAYAAELEALRAKLGLARDAAAASPLRAVEHVQLAMPPGREAEARAFYTGLLGLPETPKPPHLARRGGAWFESARVKIHLGVEQDFTPARKAHPALLVERLPALVAKLRAAGCPLVDDEPLAGYDRIYVSDPFGNRIELMEPKREP